MGHTANVYPGETIEFSHNGQKYIATIEHDPDMGFPWEEHDGHGIVSKWEKRDKRPGEVIIAEDRHGSRIFYDFQATVRLARSENWGYLPGELEFRHFEFDRETEKPCGGAARCNGVEFVDWQDVNVAIRKVYEHFTRLETPRQRAANAAKRDLECCRAYLNDEWQWVGITVRKADDCECCGETASLWGIESVSDYSYFLETAKELAEQVETKP